ncbi:MAG: hypothetical protein JWM87_3196 [Candidatus Eremiobacteraeota bacterium]|nr:hypothetical protein [Candidatus Eremiobacteraeota bacterium]
MPAKTDPRALKAISEAAVRFIEQFRKEDKPPTRMAFPNAEWRFLDTGRRVLFFRRPETVAAREGLRKRFRRAEWTAAWSEQRIAEVEAMVIAEALDNASEANLATAMERAAATLDSEPPKWIVVIPIARLLVGDFVLTFRGIDVKAVSAERYAEISHRLHDIISTTPHTDDEKVQITKEADEIIGLLRNGAAAFVTVAGDPPLAKSRALQLLQPIIDLVQLSAAVNHPYGSVSIGVGGDIATRQPPLLMMNADGSHIRNEDLGNFTPPYEMEPQHIEQMKTWGFGALIDALGAADRNRTDFELLLLNAMHWIAEAERQVSLENKVTSYVTAIDMFFAAKDAPLTRDISEGTAFVLGKTLEQRKAIVRDMTRFYAIRSGVAHSGKPVDEAEAAGLKVLTINFLAKMSSMADKFASKDDVRTWLAEQRLS